MPICAGIPQLLPIPDKAMYRLMNNRIYVSDINVRLKLQYLHFKQVVGLKYCNNLGKIFKILEISGGKQGAI